MSIQPTIKLDELPRMADFTVWGCAIAEALGYKKEEFLDAYSSNIQAQNREALEGSPIGELIITFRFLAYIPFPFLRLRSRFFFQCLDLVILIAFSSQGLWQLAEFVQFPRLLHTSGYWLWQVI